MKRGREEWPTILCTVLLGALPATVANAIVIALVVPSIVDMPGWQPLVLAALWVACALAGTAALWRVAFFRIGAIGVVGLLAAILAAIPLAIASIQAASKFRSIETGIEGIAILNAMPLLVAAVHIYRAVMVGIRGRRRGPTTAT